MLHHRHLPLVFGLALAFLLATMGRAVGPFDEGVVIFGAERVASGDIPYRDFYANYGPAQFYVLAALFKAFGTSILVSRLWDSFVRAAVVTIVYAIPARIGMPRIAVAAATISTLWLSAFQFYGYTIFPCMLFALLGLNCVTSPIGGHRRPLSSIVIGGGCVAIVSLFRHDVGLLTAVAFVAAFAVSRTQASPASPRREPPLLSIVASFAVGFLLVSLPAWGILLLVAPAKDVISNLLTIPLSTYAPMRSLPFPTLGDLPRALVDLNWQRLGDYAVFLPPLSVAAGALPVLLPSRDAGSPNNAASRLTSGADPARTVYLLLLTLCLAFFLKGVVRVSEIHMALAIIPALLIAAMLWHWASAMGATALAAVLLSAATLLVSMGAIQRAYWTGAKNVNWALQLAASGKPCSSAAGLERVGCFAVAEEQLEAVKFVRARTADSDRIYVGVPRHDLIFANNVLFYFLADRVSATKWHHFDPGVQTTAPIQAEIVRELQSAAPPFVVLTSDWIDVREPNRSSISSGVTLLDDYIRSSYRRVAVFGKNEVYELRDEGRRRPP